MRHLLPALLFGALLALGMGEGARAASPFADWAAVIVAGDWHAHSGEPSEVFDNARRDLAQAFVAAGFSPANLRQFSVRPEQYPDAHPSLADPPAIMQAMSELTTKAKGGCLVYITSHGAPSGTIVGERVFTPAGVAHMLDQACADRPTVAVISACFSGVFVPALAGSNRMVLTAARPDRSSFGCGEADKYPYFDQCILETLPQVGDFAALGTTVQGCVAARETKEGMKPASEPQLFVGAALKPMLPLLPLAPSSLAGPKRN